MRGAAGGAAEKRFRPVLVDETLVAMLGLMPAALSHGTFVLRRTLHTARSSFSLRFSLDAVEQSRRSATAFLA